MARKEADQAQIRLFDDSPAGRALEAVPPADHPERLRELAAGLDPRLRLGTSSWSFPGWTGLVWSREHSQADLARRGLAAYAAHPLMRTVGLDRAFYTPLSEAQYRDLGAQTPEGFSFLIKAHQAVTRPDANEKGFTFGDTGALREAGTDNPLFLDAAYAIDRVIGPATLGLKENAGPIVFQFPPLDLLKSGRLGGARAFLDRLAAFLARLPRAGTDRWGGPRYVVEVRNRELLAPANVAPYTGALREAGAAHGYAVHPTMPTPAQQEQSLSAAGFGLAAQPHLSLRWLLIPTMTYQTAFERYTPFNRLVDPDVPTRTEVAALIRAALDAGKNAWIIANNKAEGSAPRTLERLAEAIALA